MRAVGDGDGELEGAVGFAVAVGELGVNGILVVVVDAVVIVVVGGIRVGVSVVDGVRAGVPVGVVSAMVACFAVCRGEVLRAVVGQYSCLARRTLKAQTCTIARLVIPRPSLPLVGQTVESVSTQ